MSVPVPLGVRIYSPAIGLDMWVTKYVSDLTYRSVIPGGFASASFTLQTPQNTVQSMAAWAPRPERIPLVRLFNRIQIVDLRSGAIAWEGRIESAARSQTDLWAWEIGCAGAMAAATDITRPVFYADSETKDWTDLTGISSVLFGGSTKGDSAFGFNVGVGGSYGAVVGGAASAFPAFTYNLPVICDQFIGRFTVTYTLTPGAGTGIGNLRVVANLFSDDGTTAAHAGVDNTLFGTGTSSTKTNVQGTDWTEPGIHIIQMGFYTTSATDVTPASGKSTNATFGLPVVIAQRMDRFGNELTAASNYAHDYVTVSQVVEDVLGRFLGDHYTSQGVVNGVGGSVSPVNAYIDTSDTTAITNLKWPDGTTAQDILNTLMTVQTDAYWAIWESRYTATDDQTKSKFRFEWSTWDAGWGYLASSADGIDEQPDGSNIYNFVYQIYNVDEGYGNPLKFLQEWWDFTAPPFSPLLTDNFSRSAVAVSDAPDSSDSEAVALAQNFIRDNGTEKNAGTITVSRPIQVFGSGAGEYAGAGGMVDPHMIRPGRLLRLTDIPAQARNESLSHGDTAAPPDHVGSVWRVVATTYDTERNECVMELDQPATWTIPGQIVSHSGKAGNIRNLVS